MQALTNEKLGEFLSIIQPRHAISSDQLLLQVALEY